MYVVFCAAICRPNTLAPHALRLIASTYGMCAMSWRTTSNVTVGAKECDIFSNGPGNSLRLTHLYELMAKDACLWKGKRGVLGIDDFHSSIVYKYGRDSIRDTAIAC